MYPFLRQSFLLFFLSFTLISCSQPESNFKVELDFLGNTEISVTEVPLHYKYSPKESYSPISRDGNTFEFQIPADSDKWILLRIGDEELPLLFTPTSNISITASRASFPKITSIEGYSSDWISSFASYLDETDFLDAEINREMNKYRDGESNTAIELSTKKIEIAERLLSKTPYQYLHKRAIGEYLVNRIKSVEYRFNNPNFNADEERQKVLEEAKEMDFFTLESLEAQRAGIRDFTHYYARTFGIYDSVNTEYGKNLAEYDIKRVAYESLDQKRMQVVNEIEDEQARAYAKLFLVAERIGEIEIEKAKPTYNEFLQKYSNYPEYIDFITYFYDEIESVSPGNDAIPFSIPDQNGKIHTLEDYKGKYVLLDFWAGWCAPCLEEFPLMRDIYAQFSRDDFEILGISTEVDKAIWEQDITRFQNPWPQLYGGNGFEQETFVAYKGGGIPFYILVNPEGKIERYNDIRATFNLQSVLESLIKN